MLYIIHGLLHLAGHEDADPKERKVMEVIQVQILEQVWIA
jgi:ssRNA-specific RNase YbeY (16S rRNA maturation enzyme)